jgi:glycosyltransferase involved in cell wall biosynthesis
VKAEIALIHYTAPPIVGGVERIVGRQAALMADAGHCVRIVAGRGASPDPRIRFAAIPLADSVCPEIAQVGAELAAGAVTPAFGALVRRISTDLAAALDGVDVAIVHNVASLNRNLALTAALRAMADRPSGPRLILWHHDLAWTLPRYRPTLHEGEPWSLLRTAWPGVLQVTISESRRRDLAELMGIPPASITVVPGGVDVPTPHSVPRPTQAFAEGLALESFSPLLLAPARVTPRKNIELAIRVVAVLREMGQPAGLVVTGPVDPHDPAERSYLDRLLTLRHELGLHDAVLFLAEGSGSPAQEHLDDLYRACDVVFLPSLDEGFGLPILEAAVHGLPIVCSDLPALRELAGDAAVYVDPDSNPRAAAAAVLTAVDRGADPALESRVRSEYAWETVYRRHVEPLLARALATVES